MGGWYRFVAVSEHWTARTARRLHRAATHFSVPAPRLLVRPLLGVVLAVRFVYYFFARVFWCEPLFKAYCKKYGRNVRTGVYLHWIQGKGDLVLGDHVTIDGKCSFSFAARYRPHPTLTIGDHTGIGHNCAFVVGDRITIGTHCRIALNVHMFDVSGHSADPAERLAGKPSPSEEVRPITIGNNVWIGSGAVIYPGVTIGDNSIVSLGSVVMSSVPANTVVAGNPARQIRSLVRSRAEKD
ncbi:MAG TPA: DapH/DapD/GlmU-related protein [Bryobacteraceae bacterium]|nr:DapH/DapD/GlmU-related protein [Bryobacteraceae bacterium]